MRSAGLVEPQVGEVPGIRRVRVRELLVEASPIVRCLRFAIVARVS